MTEVDLLLAGNRAYAGSAPVLVEAMKPARRLAVVTCMDARLDPLAAFGLAAGDAHVIRNAGGRVTDDALRSLAISVPLLGVETVVVMQHTGCGLVGTTDEQLRSRTGADVAFHAIADQDETLRADVELVAATPWLAPVREVAGFVYDVGTGAVREAYRWSRPA